MERTVSVSNVKIADKWGNKNNRRNNNKGRDEKYWNKLYKDIYKLFIIKNDENIIN